VDAKQKYDEIFNKLGPDRNGFLSGNKVREPLMATGLSAELLRDICELSDFDKKGQLDHEEFALAMYLCQMASEGQDLPQRLPPEFLPPSKQKSSAMPTRAESLKK